VPTEVGLLGLLVIVRVGDDAAFLLSGPTLVDGVQMDEQQVIVTWLFWLGMVEPV